MIVDSYLEMYTTLFGWLFYNNLWYVLEDTGLLLLPFVGMVLDYLSKYSEGSIGGDREDLAFRGLLGDIIKALLVIMFCGVPYLNFEAEEVVFTPSSIQSSFDDSEYTPSSLSSTFGQGLSFSGYPLTVDVPAFWWFVHDISLGVTRATIEGLPNAIDLRLYLENMREVDIKDDSLRRELGDFKRDCYVPALSKYMTEKPNEGATFGGDIIDIFDDHGDQDPYWLGSRVYLSIPGYYDSLRAKVTVPGFPYNNVRDVEWDVLDPNLPEFGRPWCDSWWGNAGVGLRERIFEQTDSDTRTMSSLIDGLLLTERREDMIVKTAIYQSPVHYTPRGYDISYENTSAGNNGFIDALQRGGRDLIAGVSSATERFKSSINVTMMLNAAPIVQALLLMLVIIFIPFVLFLSKYSFSSVLMVAWALFSFRFLSACWYFAWWLDQNILGALYAEEGALTELAIKMEGDLITNDLLYYLLNYLYLVIPILFTVVTGWAGYNVIKGVGSGTMMGGLSNAGGNTAGKLGSAAKGSVTRVAKSR